MKHCIEKSNIHVYKITSLHVQSPTQYTTHENGPKECKSKAIYTKTTYRILQLLNSIDIMGTI